MYMNMAFKKIMEKQSKLKIEELIILPFKIKCFQSFYFFMQYSLGKNKENLRENPTFQLFMQLLEFFFIVK